MMCLTSCKNTWFGPFLYSFLKGLYHCIIVWESICRNWFSFSKSEIKGLSDWPSLFEVWNHAAKKQLQMNSYIWKSSSIVVEIAQLERRDRERMREFSVLYFIFLLGQFAVTVHTSLLKVQFLDNIGNEVGKIKQASSSLLFSRTSCCEVKTILWLFFIRFTVSIRYGNIYNPTYLLEL